MFVLGISILIGILAAAYFIFFYYDVDSSIWAAICFFGGLPGVLVVCYAIYKLESNRRIRRDISKTYDALKI